ncbi:MAG: DUF2384 domain-containing protein [Bacteroidetes bacterium]|nr:DUF2384 domain-containing protein [Bacteroidota bacterium]
MKKNVSKEIPSKQASDAFREPMLAYSLPIKKATNRQLLVRDFDYHHFKKIADKAPFTIADWADILHISERTLHRYAKENTIFSGLQVELILLSEKLISMGNELFGKDGFKTWLNSSVFSLQNKKPKELLHSYAGIQEVINTIGRIQHGISA